MGDWPTGVIHLFCCYLSHLRWRSQPDLTPQSNIPLAQDVEQYKEDQRTHLHCRHGFTHGHVCFASPPLQVCDISLILGYMSSYLQQSARIDNIMVCPVCRLHNFTDGPTCLASKHVSAPSDTPHVRTSKTYARRVLNSVGLVRAVLDVDPVGDLRVRRAQAAGTAGNPGVVAFLVGRQRVSEKSLDGQCGDGH